MTKGATVLSKPFLELLSTLRDVYVLAYYFSKTSSEICDCSMKIVLCNENRRPQCRCGQIPLHGGGISTRWKCRWWMPVRGGESRGEGGYAKAPSRVNSHWRL